MKIINAIIEEGVQTIEELNNNIEVELKMKYIRYKSMLINKM